MRVQVAPESRTPTRSKEARRRPAGSRRIEIVEARSPEQLAAFADLVRDFVAWCRVRYAERSWAVDTYFQPDALEQELAALGTKYAAPHNALLLALVDGEPAGCIAFRTLGDGVCELKRLFIDDCYRGMGLGKRLTSALISLARRRGFRTMRLETGDKQFEARALYQRLGFREVPPYYDAPGELLPYLIFMELKL